MLWIILAILLILWLGGFLIAQLLTGSRAV